MKQRILITGASGLIGRVLEGGLGGNYVVSGLDRRQRSLGRRERDMARLRSVQSAFSDHDIVIDLAANPSPTAGWDVVYRNNLLATFNAFEASRRAGVRRVIFASSTHVTGLYERDEPYASIVSGRYEQIDRTAIPLLRTDAAIRPDGIYAVGKAFGEALGRMYAETHDLSVICLRIGSVIESDRPREARHFATLLTHADLVRLVRCAIDAPADLRYAVFYGVSNNAWRFWDINEARQAIGYEPQNDAEAWR